MQRTLGSVIKSLVLGLMRFSLGKTYTNAILQDVTAKASFLTKQDE